MQIFHQTFLLFTLNLIDAILTIYWVRHGFATEGNQLMAGLLDMGDFPFLAVKVTMGALAAIVLWRWANLRMARIGLAAALAVYFVIMGVHLFTGLSVYGLVSENALNDLSNWSQNCFALFV